MTGDIQRVTDEATGERYLSMTLAVSDLLEAIQAVPAQCDECYLGAVLEVPCDTPLQWEVVLWHDADCSQAGKGSRLREASARPEATVLRLLPPLPGSGKS